MPSANHVKTALVRSKALLIGGILLLISVILLNPVSRQAIECSQFHTPTTGIITYKNEQIAVEKVTTDATHEKGLSERPCIKEGQAMEFVYPPGDTRDHCIWMKDMRFPIDIIWIGDGSEIVTIAKAVEPSTYPQTFCPRQPTLKVLEMKAGTADHLKMAPGDFIRF